MKQISNQSNDASPQRVRMLPGIFERMNKIRTGCRGAAAWREGLAPSPPGPTTRTADEGRIGDSGCFL